MSMSNNDTKNESSTSSTTDLSPYEILSLAFLMLETVIGTLVNGYIMIVNLIDLVIRRKLGSGDIILACLSLSRFGFQFLVLGLYMLSFSNQGHSQSNINNLQYIWLFFHNISIWLATLLSVFYCVRIVNIHHCIFVFLKAHFDRCVPCFILLSAGISALCSNSYAYAGLNNVFNMSKYDRVNTTSSFILGGSDFATFSTISAVAIVPPFLLFCVSTGLVVGSLLRHTSKVKGQEKTGFKEPSLKAHYRAITTMGAFFVFFLLYIIAFNLYVYGIGNDIWGSLCTMIIGAYPSLHSLVLAIKNRKLAQTFMKILQKGQCYHGDVNPIETIDS